MQLTWVVEQIGPREGRLLRECQLSCATAETRQLRKLYKKTDLTKENSFSLVESLETSSVSFSSGRPTSPTPAFVAILPPELGVVVVGGDEEEVKGRGGHQHIMKMT